MLNAATAVRSQRVDCCGRFECGIGVCWSVHRSASALLRGIDDVIFTKGRGVGAAGKI